MAFEFAPLIEKYGLLKHIDERDLLNRADINNRIFYAVAAFQSADERNARHIGQNKESPPLP